MSPAHFDQSTSSGRSGPWCRYGTCTELIGNYLTTDQVLAVGGIQFQSEPLRKRNHLVELRMLHHAMVTMSR